MPEIGCPYCKQPLKLANEIARCSICRTSHHLVCWEQHKACSVRGCHGNPAVVEFHHKQKTNLKFLVPVIVILAVILLFLLLR